MKERVAKMIGIPFKEADKRGIKLLGGFSEVALSHGYDRLGAVSGVDVYFKKGAEKKRKVRWIYGASGTDKILNISSGVKPNHLRGIIEFASLFKPINESFILIHIDGETLKIDDMHYEALKRDLSH